MKKQKKKLNKCSKCGKELPDNLLFSYIDESNIAITKNSPDFCWRCYNEKYPNDKISLFQILRQYGHKVIHEFGDSTFTIDGKLYKLYPGIQDDIIKEYDL